MIELPILGLFMAAIVSGCLGALVAAAYVVHALRKGSLIVRTVHLPRQVVELETLQLSVKLQTEDNRIVGRASHSVMIKSSIPDALADWLDENGLVVQFKGPDFATPVKQSTHRPAR